MFSALHPKLFLFVIFLLGIAGYLFFVPPKVSAQVLIDAPDEAKPGEMIDVRISNYQSGWNIILDMRDSFGRTTWSQAGNCIGIGGRPCHIKAKMPDSGTSATLVVCRRTAGGPELVGNCRDLSKVEILGQKIIKIIGGGVQLTKCGPGGSGIDTALGCIPVENLNSFASWFLKWAIGIGGGVAFLLILWSGFQIMTSTGNPERLKAGKEQLTAAITGLLFLIFSVFLLRLIGVEILKLPGF